MAKNPVVFWELASHYADKSADFFKKVFEWDTMQEEGSPIIHFATESNFGKYDGGVFTLRKAKLPFLTIYIQVENIHEKVKAIEENGGHIVEPVNEIIPDLLICLFNEPSGVTFAMLQRL